MNDSHEYAISIITSAYWSKKSKFLMPMDRYPELAIFIVEEGAFRYTIRGVSGTASKWDLVVCPQETDFYREIVSDTLSFHFLLITWRESNAMAIKYKDLLETLPDYKINVAKYDRIIDNTVYLSKLQNNNYLSSYKLREHLVNDLSLILYLETEKKNQAKKIQKDSIISEIKRSLDSKAFEGVRIKDVAAEFNLSKTQVTRRFKEAYGVNPVEYLTSLRMQKAKAYLADTDYTVEHIAQLCGYENGFYFSRVFSKQEQISPKQYRLTHSL